MYARCGLEFLLICIVYVLKCREQASAAMKYFYCCTGYSLFMHVVFFPRCHEYLNPALHSFHDVCSCRMCIHVVQGEKSDISLCSKLCLSQTQEWYHKRKVNESWEQNGWIVGRYQQHKWLDY